MTSAWLHRGRRAALAVVLAGAVGGVARAESPPSVWDVAKDPAERDRWALHMRVERLMHPPVGEGALRLDDELRLEAARAMLEEADAAHSPDVRLRFDLGVAYSALGSLQRRNDMQQKVVDVLAPALASADVTGGRGGDRSARGAGLRLRQARPTSRGARDLAQVHPAPRRRSRPRDRDDEHGRGRDAPRPRRRRARDVPRGGATLRGAAQHARRGVDLRARPLGRGGRARSLGRPAGSPRDGRQGLVTWISADGRARTSSQRTRTCSSCPIGSASGTSLSARLPRRARPTDARDAAVLWAAAERSWGQYVARAAAAGGHDPWIAIARVRLDHARTQRLGAEQRAAKLPPRPPSRGGQWIEN